MSWWGRRELTEFLSGRRKRSALEISPREFRRGWGRVGEGQVAQNEECKTDLKAKLKKEGIKTRQSPLGGSALCFLHVLEY